MLIFAMDDMLKKKNSTEQILTKYELKFILVKVYS